MKKLLKKILKITFIVLGCLLVVAGLFYTYVYLTVKARIEKTYTGIPLEQITVNEDSAAIALGDHLTEIKGCKDCHGKDLAGKIMIDDPALGRIVTANLTHGKGGLPADYKDEEWVKALRHGISPRDAQPLLVMPSHELNALSQEDIAGIIAYCKQLKPVDNELPEINLRPLAYVLTYFDKLPLLPAEMIDHTVPAKESVEKAVSVEYGQYLSVSCVGCHQTNFKGGAAIVPGSPDVADITASGNVGKWTEDQFLNTLRTGKTPEGKVLQNEFMPWEMTKSYTDDELKSLYKYLQTLKES